MFLNDGRVAMAATLTFYTNPMSRGQIARWAIEESGAPYETVLLDYATTMNLESYDHVSIKLHTMPARAGWTFWQMFASSNNHSHNLKSYTLSGSTQW
jgi:glutathione S-transferase